jgi:hypothetical protein
VDSQQLSVSSKQLGVIGFFMGVLLCFCGCAEFRYAATEAQKENAWLHERVCAMAAETAVGENTSAQLCGLTELAHAQSTAFVMDYGLPQSLTGQSSQADLGSENPLPPSGYSPLAGGELNDILAQAKADSARRPDVWSLADHAMELGIALAGLVGGVYGVRIAGYLKTAREKSAALKEIVTGNELFKQLYPEQASRFKEAQQQQSATTQKLVTELKAG